MSEKKLNIKSWAEEDRPREKLLLKGKDNLSEAELLAILLGSGSKDKTAVDLAKEILSKANNSLLNLSDYTISSLMEFKGIGQAKAVTIMAALELGRRRQQATKSKKQKITCSRDAANVLSFLQDKSVEEFWVLMLNRANEVIARRPVSQGGITGTVVDVRIIFKEVLETKKAVSIIVAHNHPSGNLHPSQHDLSITKKIVDAGKLLDINVLDHIIITQTGYYSFGDEGNL